MTEKQIVWYILLTEVKIVEKARAFDPFGHAGFDPFGRNKNDPCGRHKNDPCRSIGRGIFCSFETPCPGTAGINLKNYRI